MNFVSVTKEHFSMRTISYLFMRTFSDRNQVAFIKVMADSAQTTEKACRSRFWKQMGNIVDISLGDGLLFIIIMYFLFPLLRKKHRLRKTAAPKGEEGFLKMLSVLLPRFTFDELKEIT